MRASARSSVRVRIGVSLAALGAGAPALLAAAPSAGAAQDPVVVCRFSDVRLTEISGITWSARHRGVYWVHNDSGGGPYLYAIDGSTCATLARIRVAGIGARDMEAIATGVDPSGRPVLWLGDIGDNRDSWPSVRLHAVPEPSTLVDQEVSATTYRFTYSDGPHNAEGIIADPRRARVWVVTKQIAAGGVWSVPLSTSTVTKATRVGDVGGLVTDAAMSPDGATYVIRDYLRAQLHTAPVSATSLTSSTRIDLPGQTQGEAISFTADGSALLVASERETELWRVALPDSSSASPSSSASGTGSPAPDPSGSAGRLADPESGWGAAGPARTVAAVLAVAAGAVIAVTAARRLRR